MKIYLCSLLIICLWSMNCFSDSVSSNNQKGGAFNSNLMIGHAYVDEDRPKEALNYYSKALHRASTGMQQRMALFRLARVQLWLNDYSGAEASYRRLLSSKLTKIDYEMALAGLIFSLNFQDYPIEASQYAPIYTHFLTPQLLLAVSQSNLWKGNPEGSRKLLDVNRYLIEKSNPHNYLTKQLHLIDQTSYQQTAKQQFTPFGYFERDSNDFIIRRYGFNYAYRFRDNLQTAVTLVRNYYSQKGYSNISGTVYDFEQRWQVNPCQQFNFTLGRVDFSRWNPFTWSFLYGYRSNDRLGIKLYGKREVIETLLSLSNKITSANLGLNLAYMPFYRFNTQVDIFHRDYSDGNNQNGLYSQLSYLMSIQWGLSSALRLRGFINSQSGSQNYFDPKNYSEGSAILQWRQGINPGYQFYLDCGLGLQKVNPGTTSPTQLLELGLNLLFTRHVTLQMFAGYTNSDFSSNTGYNRKYGGLNIHFYL